MVNNAGVALDGFGKFFVSFFFFWLSREGEGLD